MTACWFTWGLARAALLVGGVLNDQIAPQAIWYGGLAIGAVSAVILLALAREKRGEKIAADG
ncbi:MAG: hypothetical protein FD146_1871 [Anaerolineaceae bacterium]|nr:MAG: hypothetical protein FD146_1871 [Anaerolineaceae bacterium]